MNPLRQGAMIGILGGGQLGRMLSSAAAKLGFDASIYSPEVDGPAARLAAGSVVGAYDDVETLHEWASRCDVLTYEFENVPTPAVEELIKRGHKVRPGAESLRVAQDRLVEKTFLRSCGIDTATFYPVATLDDLHAGLQNLGGGGLLKTRRDGYDGKGQVFVSPGDDLEAAWASVVQQPCILEAVVPFTCEISVVVARGSDGATNTFDAPLNRHKNGILTSSTVPSGLDVATEEVAQAAAHRLAAKLNHVGVLTLECFVLEDGSILANEFAPRVHNSGHWTVEACRSSQFEQHILAVADWPLGSNQRLFDAEMGNLIGADVDSLETLLPQGAKLTLYGKREARSGRKMGHWVKLRASL